MFVLKQSYYYLRGILFAVLVFFVTTSNATVYYVSESGDDSNVGTSEDQPWKTLSKVNKIYKFEPGDQILFKRGNKWTGTLTVNTSGSEGNPIVYGAYGTGEKPTIYGSEVISEWTLYSGNIYKANFNSEITQLFINGKRVRIARFPNNGYLAVDALISNFKFTCNELDSDVDYKGATVIARTVRWLLETNVVTSSISNTLTIGTTFTYKAKTGMNFFLNNKLEFLDSPGEWYYDKKTKTVYLWTPKGDSPDNYIVRGSNSENGVSMTNKNFITIKDISFEQHQGHAINTNSCDNLTVENSTILNCGGSGIYFYPNFVSGLDLKNNIIRNTGQTAIFGRTSKSVISENKIKDVALFDEIGIRGVGTGVAISVNGNDNVLKWNEISNIGYSGISFMGERTLLEYNYIDSVCNTITDGGGIYTYTGQDISKPGSSGSIIRNNIVVNCLGELEEETGKYSCNGIYLDEGTRDVTVKHNTIAHIGYAAIFLNITSNNKIEFNTVYDAPILFMYAGMYKPSIIENNVFVTADRNGSTAWWRNSFQRLNYQYNNAKGIFDYNTYASHYTKENAFQPFVDFAAWKTSTGQDINSSYDVSRLPEGETEKLFYNSSKNKFVYNLGNATFRDVYGKLVKDTFSLKPFTSQILIGKNFEQINQSPEISDQTFNIRSPKYLNDSIAKVFAFDANTSQILTYHLLNENKMFSIDSLSGNIFASEEIQIPIDTTVELVVIVSDNAINNLSDSAKISINIEGSDLSPPEISFFSIPSNSMSLTIQIDSFSATDNLGIGTYILKETPDFPGISDTRWSSYIPETYTFHEGGRHVLYLWVKDLSGNISNPASDTVIINLPDLSSTYSEYLFEDSLDSPVVLDSNGPNNGVIINDVTPVEGASGNGMKFSGSGYIDLGFAFSTNVQDAISLSAWIKPVTHSIDYQVLVIHEGLNNETFGLNIYPESGRIEFVTNGTTNPDFGIDGNFNLWDGEWHHLAAIYNGSNKIIYMDGEILAKIDATGTINSGEGLNLFIGAELNDLIPTNSYHGNIDEVKIYNYALNTDEVAELYKTVNRIQKKTIITEDVSICEGENYLGWSESGEYTRTLRRVWEGASGADSIINTNLIVHPTYMINEVVNICEGEDYTFGNQILNITGDYVETFETVSGCDSTIYLHLNVNRSYYTVFDTIISPGQSYMGWTDEGTYLQNLVSITGCDSIVTTNLKIEESYTQYINLEKGWNIFSTYLTPINGDVDAIMEKLRDADELIEVVDENKNTYKIIDSNNNWQNNIGQMQESEGYKINVSASCILEIVGHHIELPLSINLKKGSNLVSFPLNGSVDAMAIITPLINDGILEKVQDEKGNAIENWGSFNWINGIGYFSAGEGYIVQVNRDGILTMNNIVEKSSAPTMFNNLETTYFNPKYYGNGWAHMNINIVGLSNLGLKAFDEIAVYDRNICVGAKKLDDNNFIFDAISIPASASEANLQNGFTEGNPISIKIWRNDINEVTQLLPEVLKGEMVFYRQGSVFIKLTTIDDISNNVKIFPNPANNIVNIQLHVLPDDGVQMLMQDISGKTILDFTLTANQNILDVKDIPAGLYFLKIFEKNFVSTIKLIIN